MRIEILKMLYLKSPKLFRFASCGLIDQEEFEKKYMGKDQRLAGLAYEMKDEEDSNDTRKDRTMKNNDD
jgi:hypothetical protein